jgi:LytS/YehU family sensor histidine kinase
LLSKPEEANRNLLTLARLMRSCVVQPDKLSRSLTEELDFLQNYPDLMKARSEQWFEYHIEIEDTVDLQWQVPRMVTQIYVENAINHGLKPSVGLSRSRNPATADTRYQEISQTSVTRYKPGQFSIRIAAKPFWQSVAQ